MFYFCPNPLFCAAPRKVLKPLVPNLNNEIVITRTTKKRRQSHLTPPAPVATVSHAPKNIVITSNVMQMAAPQSSAATYTTLTTANTPQIVSTANNSYQIIFAPANLADVVGSQGGLNIIQQPQAQQQQHQTISKVTQTRKVAGTAAKRMTELQTNEPVVFSANDPNLSSVLKSLGVNQSQPVYIQNMSPNIKIVKAESTNAQQIAMPITLPMNSALPFGNATTITLPMSTTITQKRVVQQQQQQSQIQLHQLTNVQQTRRVGASTIRSQTIKYADMDDIELPDGTKIGYATVEAATDEEEIDEENSSMMDDVKTEPGETLAEKYSIIAASAVKNDAADTSANANTSSGAEENVESYACRHCGKRYRWKSTLRRHENDECGGKEPSHQCPYCSYKAKQRGNLGVHVRKHHGDQPQLVSKRKKRSIDGMDSLIELVTKEENILN